MLVSSTSTLGPVRPSARPGPTLGRGSHRHAIAPKSRGATRVRLGAGATAESPRPPLGARPSRTLENGRRPVAPPTSEPPEASGKAVGQVRLAARSRANGQNAAFAASRALRHRGSRGRHDPKPRPVHDRTSAIDPRPYARMACVPVRCEVADFECTVTGAHNGLMTYSISKITVNVEEWGGARRVRQAGLTRAGGGYR